MQPHWLTILSWVALALGFASALVILVDELVLGYRQHMPIMNLVHPVTALYWGPVWLWLYFTRGRRASRRWEHERAEWMLRDSARASEAKEGGELLEARGESTGGSDIRPWHIGNAVSHCGAGCTLGDICGEWLVFALGIDWFGTWSGHQLPEELLLDFVFAWAFGVVFQYFTIAPMTGETGPRGVWRAIRVDSASIVAFQLGLFGWMAVYMLVIWPHHGITIDSPGFWFQMQIGMILGYFTAWPVNRWLVANGIKEKMDHRRHLGMLVQDMAEEHGVLDEPTRRDRESAAGGLEERPVGNASRRRRG